MSTRTQRTILMLTDALTILGAWVVFFLLRVRSGWVQVPIEPDLLAPMVLIYFFWAIVFFLVGLYRPWYAASRFDELVLLFKTTGLGCLFLFFVIFIDDAGKPSGTNARLLIVLYWVILFSFVALGRLTVRSIQRRLLAAGIGARNTIIVGNADPVRGLYEQVIKYPALGYRVIGFMGVDRRWTGQTEKTVPFLGHVDDLTTIVPKHQVQEVLIALDSADHDRLLEIVGRCAAFNVGLKIVPDLYDIISGMARTNQIYGFPLIEISPQLLKPWEEGVKRFIDIAVAGIVVMLGFPLWLLIALAIKLESAGPVLYRQERVGKDGHRFNIFKFRSMHEHAEREGPRWAGKQDPRVTRIGRVLRKLHLDEIPQALNVLKGEMSLVGPRPERPMFVEELTREIPMYPRRLRVRPGITGWAQVKHKYDESVDDVRKKVQYDFFYIENISLRMDFKILLSTVSHMLMGKGH